MVNLTSHPGRQQEIERVKEQLRLLQRIAKIGLWEWKPKTNRFYWSEELYRIMGIEEHDFDEYLQTYLSLVYKDDIPYVKQAIEADIAGNVPPDFEHRIIRTDGEVRNVYLRCISIPDKEGKLAVTGLVEDVTETKQKDKALKNVSRRLTSSIENIANGFFSVDKLWRIIHLNKTAEKIFHRTHAEIKNKVLWEKFSHLIGTEYERQLRYAMQHNLPVAFEALYSGLDIWCEVHAFPSEEGLNIYFQDVIERLKSQQALRENHD